MAEGQRSSLGPKLRRAVLLTTGLSLILLVLALVLIVWLGQHALKVTRGSTPVVLQTTEMRTGIRRSFSGFPTTTVMQRTTI